MHCLCNLPAHNQLLMAPSAIIWMPQVWTLNRFMRANLNLHDLLRLDEATRMDPTPCPSLSVQVRGVAVMGTCPARLLCLWLQAWAAEG